MTAKKPGNRLPSPSEFLLYTSEGGLIRIEIRMQNETVWLSINQMAELFQVDKSGVSRHIKNVFESGELARDSVVANFATTAADGKTYQTEHFNLDMVISVGYRVNSIRGTQFRIWATQRLREYLVKGFALDDERLKNPDQPFDYFEELTRRIQDIRTSERRFYRKVTDIYATSVDYDPTQDISIGFFKMVQNRMHWAISGMTAAEIVHARADAQKPNMGLTNWRGEKVRKADVGIAKNYLEPDELAALNNLVEQYLIFAEGQALRRIPMTMQDWIKKLDGFLTLNDREILNHAGRISHQLAMEHAEAQFEAFHIRSIGRSSDEPAPFEALERKTEALTPAHKRKEKRASSP